MLKVTLLTEKIKRIYVLCIFANHFSDPSSEGGSGSHWISKRLVTIFSASVFALPSITLTLDRYF